MLKNRLPILNSILIQLSVNGFYVCIPMNRLSVIFLLLLSSIFTSVSFAQYKQELIQTNVVLRDKQQHFDAYMRNNVIAETFTQPLDSNTEYKYEAACLAASQFMLHSAIIKSGFDTLFAHYDSIEYDTKRAFLEALYGLYPNEYVAQINSLLTKETQPKLFAMQALYLYQNDSSSQQVKRIIKQLQKGFPVVDTLPVLQSLQLYLQHNLPEKQTKTPSFSSLFSYQKISGRQLIYSFQRWNRDYPGLAIIQNADGSFARDSLGHLLMFEQLARSASGLPYFITSGNTPQGIFSVQGTGISHNNLIGPTPNLQLLLPHEDDAMYWHQMPDSSLSFEKNYFLLLPPDWRNYLPMQEALQAGTVGRTAIIAHGSTIDPDYFKGKPFYPLSPTLGCLCAKENWNIFTGKLNQSDQFNFINTYLARPEDEAGYLFVINIDNQQAPVSREEVEKLVSEFEKGN